VRLGAKNQWIRLVNGCRVVLLPFVWPWGPIGQSLKTMLKAAKVLRIFSVLLFLATLLFTYAYVPLTLEVNIEALGRVGREHFFYFFLILFVVLAMMLRFLRTRVDAMGVPHEVRLWVHLLPFVVFTSLVLVIGYLGVLNNAQNVGPANYFYLNWLAVLLIAAWAVGLVVVIVRGIRQSRG
jgi:hypothetical protein